MELLRQANAQCRRLWRDEGGVVLALSVVVFMMLFLLAFSAYAVGEIIRERVELQNAADSAAYSGAMVQADHLSRIAAINRAMAWTYVMLDQMTMDYIVDKWLEKVVNQWDIDDWKAMLHNQIGMCNFGRPTYYFNGTMGMDKYVRLNQSQTVSISSIRSHRMMAAAPGGSRSWGSNYNTLRSHIIQAKANIEAMNAAEDDLISQTENRIRKMVASAVRQNIAETDNDKDAGGADIEHHLEITPPRQWFRKLRNNEQDETQFLAHADFYDGPDSTFGAGTGVWMVRSDGGEGLQRKYRQGARSLIAEWNWWSTKWVIVEGACVPAPFFRISGDGKVRGQDVQDSQFTMARAKPHVLEETFFLRDGTLAVGVKRRLNNPFFYIFGSLAEEGMFRFFHPSPDGPRDMWGVAAAIAGYQSPNEPGAGHYEITYEDVPVRKLWNLKTSDWDAELVPLHRAGASGTSGRKLQGDKAAPLLSKMRQKLGVSGQTAPRGAGNGGDLSTGGLEGWTVH
ncbi:MAG: Tad domain-containing protein [Lentisphaeria bacterium]